MVVNGGCQWWPATVNSGGQPWRTTVDHLRTTGQRWLTASQRSSLDSGRVWIRVGLPRVANLVVPRGTRFEDDSFGELQEMLGKFIGWLGKKFHTEGESLWKNVIKGIHEEEGGLNQTKLSSIKKGTWGRIIRCRHWASKHGLASRLYLDISLVTEKEYSSEKTYGVGHNHCKCNWRRPPRGGREEEELINLRSELEGAEFSNQVDYLQWSITDSRIYKVKIPTRLNLQNKGIICPSVLCPLCDLEAENIHHLFYQCSLANTLWSKVMEWWGLIFPQDLSLESIWCSVSAARLQGLVATVFYVVF
ncbi:RNA-directed DNA polymerase, eukaryota, reverse transcriptase zinc-binding domain protein [Tanacetum coccineum]